MIFAQSRRRAVLIEGERRVMANMAQGRLSLLAVFFVVAYIVLGIRLMDLTVVQGTLSNEEQAQTKIIKEIASRRGDIYDRNGFLLATTLKMPSLYVDPSMVIDAHKLADSLAPIFPKVSKAKILRTLSAKNRFGWIKHGMTPEQQQAVLDLGDPSLGFQDEYKRVYPQGDLFAHMIGFTDRDGLGLSGIERSYDDILSRGEDVHIASDLRLQHLVRREVGKAMEDFTAKAGVGLIMDAKTGEVLAGVSLPDFNLNAKSEAKNEEIFNRMTLGVYELGSMFKIFSTAAALELENIRMSQTFDAREPLKIGRFKINDYHAQKRILTVPEVFMHSSNIGSALMGKLVGSEQLFAFYEDLGLIDPMQIDIREVGRPLVPQMPWRESTLLTVSYGHGLATTPLQMSSAVASVVNGGTLVTPQIMKQEDTKTIKSEIRVVSEETSEKMRKLMRLTVTHGTGKKADVAGYGLGGKTGTAEKSVNGKYDRKKLISSFVGAFPMSDPKYVIMVMVDEPKGNKQSYGYATAGWVAAPAVQRIIGSMASVLGLPADGYGDQDQMVDDLLPHVHEKKKGGKKLVSYTR